MQLSLISHASTVALRQARFPTDEALDSIGRQKAKALAGLLTAGEIVLASTATRTRETATALGLQPALEPRLDDCHYGRWTGLSLEEIQVQDEPGMLAWLQDPEAAPHGGESLRDVQQRVVGWLDEISQQNAHVLAITHPAIIRLAILHALAADLAAFWRVEVEPLSLTHLHFSRGRWSLRVTPARLLVQGC